MSTYVIADIHGCYNELMQLLKKMDFKSSDTLFINGDTIDRGPDNMKVLRYLMMQPNIYPIMGNHEIMAYRCLKFLIKEVTEESIASLEGGFLEGLLEYREVGGEETIKEFRKLSSEEREDIIEYLSEFSPYEEVEVNGRSFVIVHAGLKNFREDRDLEGYGLDELIFEKPDYSRAYFKNRYLVTGHLPTRAIPGAEPDRVYINNNHIAIDCGAAFGGRLAAVRLDDLYVYYSD